ESGNPSHAGTVFRLNKDGSGYGIIYNFAGPPEDGALPFAGVVVGSDGALYGTTFQGGNFYSGSVFKLNRDGSGYTLLHSFQSNFDHNDGANPAAGLSVGHDGRLYGTTYFGGSRGAGCVFKLDPDGGGYALLHTF